MSLADEQFCTMVSWNTIASPCLFLPGPIRMSKQNAMWLAWNVELLKAQFGFPVFRRLPTDSPSFLTPRQLVLLSDITTAFCIWTHLRGPCAIFNAIRSVRTANEGRLFRDYFLTTSQETCLPLFCLSFLFFSFFFFVVLGLSCRNLHARWELHNGALIPAPFCSFFIHSFYFYGWIIDIWRFHTGRLF